VRYITSPRKDLEVEATLPFPVSSVQLSFLTLKFEVPETGLMPQHIDFTICDKTMRREIVWGCMDFVDLVQGRCI
jgi:hypothetical protein